MQNVDEQASGVSPTVVPASWSAGTGEVSGARRTNRQPIKNSLRMSFSFWRLAVGAFGQHLQF